MVQVITQLAVKILLDDYSGFYDIARRLRAKIVLFRIQA